MAKLSKKKTLIIAISAVLIVGIAGTTIGVSAAKKNEGPEVQFQTLAARDVQSSINATADVEAGATKEYKVGTMATVSEVFVKVGDRVAQGQLLATFNTEALNGQISELQKQYNSSAASYKTSMAAANEAKDKLAAVDAQIAELEAKIAQLAATAPSVSLPQDTGSTVIPDDIYKQIQEALAKLAANGNLNQESIEKAIREILEKAVADGKLDSSQIPSLDQLPQMGADAGSMMSGISNEMQLATLKIQRQIQEITSNTSLIDATKGMMDTTSQTLKTLREQRDVLAEGWRADFDGLITQVNVTPGADTTLLKAGIVLQGTDVMTAVITLGKYDIQKISVGMPCKISVVNGSYDGEVSFIAPTAEDSGSSSEILDGMSSTLGISGLGSLTGSKGGVRCEITIFHPDDKVIIGLDANVEITLENKEGAVALPVECLKMDKEGKYVFLYDAETKTVKKQPITVGVNSDLYYEVVDGLKTGDKIASSELSTLEDGQRVKISTKTTTKK